MVKLTSTIYLQNIDVLWKKGQEWVGLVNKNQLKGIKHTHSRSNSGIKSPMCGIKIP